MGLGILRKQHLRVRCGEYKLTKECAMGVGVRRYLIKHVKDGKRFSNINSVPNTLWGIKATPVFAYGRWDWEYKTMANMDMEKRFSGEARVIGSLRRIKRVCGLTHGLRTLREK